MSDGNRDADDPGCPTCGGLRMHYGACRERETLKAENAQLRAANLALQEALVADPIDQSTEIAQLRAQRDEAEFMLQAVREKNDRQAMRLAEADRREEQLREQLAQRTAAIQEHLRLHDHHLNGDPDCVCVVCEILQPLRDALADLSDAP